MNKKGNSIVETLVELIVAALVIYVGYLILKALGVLP